MPIFGSNDGEEEARARQREHSMHQNNLGVVDQSTSSEDREYLREITEEQLDAATYELMTNLFSHDFVLSNLNDAEVTEQKWLARVVARKIKRMHPDAASFASGTSRRVVFDDDNDALQPLNPHQENLIDQAVLQFLTRPPRSRGGWQQDEVSKQYRVSRVEDDTEDNSGGSLFG